MNLLDASTQLIDILGLSNIFGVESGNFLSILLGSFIVGYTCLTFKYKIYDNNERWTNLDQLEKGIVSLVVGFLSILTSFYIVTIYQVTFLNNNGLEQLILQLKYVSPFLYFIIFSISTAKSKFEEFDFIKKYIWFSFNFILILNFLFALIMLYIIRYWIGIFWIIIFILIILAPFIWRKYSSQRNDKNKTQN